MSFHPNRRTIRLAGYDYSQAGAYFVTICSKNREFIFGDVVNGVMRLNGCGQVVGECWKWLAQQYPYVVLDEFAIMPNHLHGVIIITNNCRGGSRTAPTNGIKHKPLGRLIGAFKTVSTKRFNEIRNARGIPIWQRNYYEHIIRKEDKLNRISEYIINNPLQWQFDRENPRHIKDEVYENQWSHFEETIYGKL